jgi:Lrp/AsnC family transcriptional regulator, regulator for asnA, asnC and gidA
MIKAIKTDAVDEGIMTILREDGRLSNREVARRLDVSEGTVRQRLKKLQDAGAIRIGVVTDANRTGLTISAWVRITVSPDQMQEALTTFSGLDEARYVAAVAGRYNLLLVLTTTSQLELMRLVNAKVENVRGVSRVDVRVIAQTVKHDIHEVVVRPTAALSKAPAKRRG